MPTTITPIAKTLMLIRRPVHDVYEAFVDPSVTTRFWFTKSTRRLDQHDHVRWEMYDVHSDIEVIEIPRRGRRCCRERSLLGTLRTGNSVRRCCVSPSSRRSLTSWIVMIGYRPRTCPNGSAGRCPLNCDGWTAHR